MVLNEQFSTWEKTLPGVSQDSVLDPRLFIIFINYVVEFVDDTKLGHHMITDHDNLKLQEALVALYKW